MKSCYELVAVTLWPKGRNVAIDNWGVPTFTNDGITVLRDVILEDNIENIWAYILKEASEKTNKLAGDWTTTTAILTYAIALEWMKHLKKGNNPFMLSKALQEVGEDIISIIKSQGKDLTTKEEVEQVATISAQDPEIGKIIADIVDEVGNDWTIIVEEWQTNSTTYEIKKWLEFDTGYISPYMANQQDDSYKATEIPILVTDQTIDNFKQIRPIMEKVLKNKGQHMIIICADMVDEALASVNLNKIQGKFDCVAIRAPGFGKIRKELLHDIAVVTWAAFVTADLGMKLEESELETLGKVNKITATMTNTIITQSEDREDAINARVERIKTDMENLSSDYELSKYQERISKLTWGIGVIKVGAHTRMEMLQKKFKIEDALNATKSAIQEWIVDWGWMALANVSFIEDDPKNEYRSIAKEIMKLAIRHPFSKITSNAWYKAQEIRDSIPIGQGFNAKDWIYCNMMEAGIIDPIKVIRVALENAISAATMLLTTEATITDEPTRSQ